MSYAGVVDKYLTSVLRGDASLMTLAGNQVYVSGVASAKSGVWVVARLANATDIMGVGGRSIGSELTYFITVSSNLDTNARTAVENTVDRIVALIGRKHGEVYSGKSISIWKVSDRYGLQHDDGVSFHAHQMRFSVTVYP